MVKTGKIAGSSVLIVGLLQIACSSRPVPATFSAKITVSEQEHVVLSGKIFVDGWKYCMNLNQEDERIGIIADRESDWSWLLMPDKKMCTYIDRDDPENIESDPFLGLQYLESKYGRSLVADSTIDGYDCVKYVIKDHDKILMTYWQSSKLHFPLRIIEHSTNEVVTELTDIIEGEFDKSVFKIPKDYTVLAQRWKP